jgi:hypothetical protein
MNFKNVAASFLSIGFLLVTAAGQAIVTSKTTGPTITGMVGGSPITGVVGGSPVTTSVGGATTTRVGSMEYTDQTKLVDFEEPFDQLNLRVMSFKNNPTEGYIALHVKYTVTPSQQTDSDMLLVGTIPGSKVGSTTDHYVYVHKDDVAKMVKTQPAQPGIAGLSQAQAAGLRGGLHFPPIGFGPGHQLPVEPSRAGMEPSSMEPLTSSAA